MMKRIWYLLLIFSYALLAFILVYFNICNPGYEGNLGLYLSALVIIIWVASAAGLADALRNTSVSHSGIDKWLRAIAALPAVILVGIPIALLFLPGLIMKLSGNNIKRNCKPLSEKGFALKKEARGWQPVYRLIRDNAVIRIREYDVYEISLDSGATFTPVRESPVLSPDDRAEIGNILEKYRTCDSRESDLYAPTGRIIGVIAKYF